MDRLKPPDEGERTGSASCGFPFFPLETTVEAIPSICALGGFFDTPQSLYGKVDAKAGGVQSSCVVGFETLLDAKTKIRDDVYRVSREVTNTPHLEDSFAETVMN